MRKLLLSLAALLAASTAAANEGATLGLGAAVGLSETVITVPINVASNLRIEPFIGFDRVKETDATDPAGDDVTTTSTFELGVGAFYVAKAAEQVELIGGARLDLSTTKSKRENAADPAADFSESFNGYGIAAVGGAEYFLSPRFALGVEAELGLRSEEIRLDVHETTIFTASFVTAKVFFK